MVGVSHFPMTTPNSAISEPHKHLRIAKPIMVQQIAPWQKRRFWVWSVSEVSSRFGFRQHYHLDRHGQLALKQLRLSVLNEMHTNSYTGPGLEINILKSAKSRSIVTVLSQKCKTVRKIFKQFSPRKFI